MSTRNTAELLLLAALWGASFLLMRLGAADFSAVALVFVRVAGASVLLLPLLWLRGGGASLRPHWRPMLLVGLLNSALPFVLFIFRLIAHAGPAKAIAVTFLIPPFAIAWGWLFLAEQPTAAMLSGCGVILLGTALATGALKWPVKPQ